MENKLIILIAGKAGVGKTTLANALKTSFEKIAVTCEIFPFAERVKAVAKEQFGWDGEKDERGRKLLINIGMMGREYNPDIWANKVLEKIASKPVEVIIIDDWRFPNEGKVIKEFNFNLFRIRVESLGREILKGTPQYNDPSENSLPSYNLLMDNSVYYDGAVFNYGDLDQVNEYAEKIVKYLVDKKILKI